MKVPTIANLLDSMSDTDQSDSIAQLRSYAALGYHWDGTDRRSLSVRKIRAFIKELDTWTLTQLPDLQIQSVDDDLNDLFGVTVSWRDQPGTTLYFRSPNLNDAIGSDDNQPRWIRTLIDKLGCPEMLELPYLAIGELTKQGLKAAGFL